MTSSGGKVSVTKNNKVVCTSNRKLGLDAGQIEFKAAKEKSVPHNESLTPKKIYLKSDEHLCWWKQLLYHKSLGARTFFVKLSKYNKNCNQ